MNGAFYIGALGLDAQQQALDVVAHNITNINTTAFKRQTVQFSELVTPAAGSVESSVSKDALVAKPSGVIANATPHVWTQGALAQTGQPLDLAIQGEGFLEVLGPSGQDLLWRGGTLEVNSDGYLATSDGNALKAMISVPLGAQNLTIDANGSVAAAINGASRQIGQLGITLVKNPDGMSDYGSGYFEVSDVTDSYSVKPGEEGGGTFVQGALESSNVQLTDEMTTLLLLQRAYGASAQVVQAGDQLMSIANGLRR